MRNGMGMGMGAGGGLSKKAIFTFTSTGTGADTGTLSLFYPASENDKIVKATGNVKLGEGGNLTEQVISGGAINTFIVTCSSGTGTLVLPNTYTRFSADTSDAYPSDGWVTSANSPSLAFDIATLPIGLVTFRCEGSNTVSGKLPTDWNSMTYFRCQGSNTISGKLPADWKLMVQFYCRGLNTVRDNLPADWKLMTYFLCDGSNTISGITDGAYAGNGNMRFLRLNSSNSLGGLSTENQEFLLKGKATRTWTGTGTQFNLATSASMADTTIPGRWFSAPGVPTEVAEALKTLVKEKNVTVVLNGLTMPGESSGDGGGFPDGFGDWWRLP